MNELEAGGKLKFSCSLPAAPPVTLGKPRLVEVKWAVEITAGQSCWDALHGGRSAQKHGQPFSQSQQLQCLCTWAK